MAAGVLFAVCLLLQGGNALDNGLALRPPMGWSSWNHFHRDWNETLFYQTVDAMKQTGLQAAGYEYVNVDGGWWAGSDTGKIHRNASGYFEWSPLKYPHGLPTLIDYVHKNGFKYGHYTDAGTHACNKDAPMSEGYESKDAALFAEWGVDMVKVDACARKESAKAVVQRWRQDLNKTGRPILFSNCRNGCLTGGWDEWCGTDTNMWRTSSDIQPHWANVMSNLDTLEGQGGHGRPGRWNDPDFLEVGNGEFADDGSALSLAMNRAHFSLWCVTSSPLILGHDVRNATQRITDIVSNRDAIAVNQVYFGNGGDVVRHLDLPKGTQVWAKPLGHGAAAAVLFNREGASSLTISVPLNTLPLSLPHGATTCDIEDIWTGRHDTLAPTDSYTSAPLIARAVEFVKIQCK